MPYLASFGNGGGGGGDVTINQTINEITASGLSQDAGQVLVEGADGGALLTGPLIRDAVDATLGGVDWRQAEAERLLTYDAATRTIGILAGTGVALPLATPAAAGLMSAADKQALDAGGGGGDARRLTVIEKSASAVLESAETYALIRFTGAGAQVLTVPPGALATGEQVSLLQSGTGPVSVAAGTGRSIVSEGALALRGQHAAATLIAVAPDTVLLVGALAEA